MTFGKRNENRETNNIWGGLRITERFCALLALCNNAECGHLKCAATLWNNGNSHRSILRAILHFPPYKSDQDPSRLLRNYRELSLLSIGGIRDVRL